MKPHLFRASGLSKIMTDPRNKGEILSEGAKTEITRIAKEMIFGFRSSFGSKETEKGTAVEQASIDLYNSVFFTSHRKNEERKSNEWITGECDIDTGRKIIDIKSSWSLETFPLRAADAESKAYEWQIRAYLMLYDRDEGEVAYCMVDTPEHLIGYDSRDIHVVSHLDEALRVTVVKIKRDQALEDKIKIKVDAAKAYLHQLIWDTNKEHNL